jgi:hypothetical protein
MRREFGFLQPKKHANIVPPNGQGANSLPRPFGKGRVEDRNQDKGGRSHAVAAGVEPDVAPNVAR